MPSSTPTLSECAREREFYRYYHKPQAVSGNTNDTPDLSSLRLRSCIDEPNGPRSSDDKALTAFAQLGALRLDARRCMITFFDRDTSYILAEATRTLSLHTDTANDEQDALYWGTAASTRGSGMCENTVALPVMYEAPEMGNYTDVAAFIVNDLSKDDRFKDRPYVMGRPHVRFYCGVPIKSPNGHNIGSYCILDDKPRDGMDAASLEFMRDMAITVMRHLELAKAKDDHRRGGLMVRGLGSFLGGKSTIREWWANPWSPSQESATVERRGSVPRNTVPSMFTGRRNSHGTSAERRPSFDSSRLSVTPETAVSSVGSIIDRSPTSSVPTPTTTTSFSDDMEGSGRSDALTGATSASPAPPTDLQETMLAPDVKSTFKRAANIIREATEVDGAVFFDASIGTFGGLVEDVLTKRSNEHVTIINGSDNHLQGANGASQGQDERRVRSRQETKLCGVLGSSSKEAAFDGEHNMTESLLMSLLRRYPRGKIFTFDEEGAGSSEGEDENAAPATIDRGMTLGSPTSTTNEWRSMKSSQWNEARLLHQSFPQARTLVLCPLWDSHRERWFAGGVIWSSSPMRVFTTEGELSYLAAFGNSIMAEVSRLDAKMADRAKADFISSISHELRSPLHGILGSVELMHDTKLDAFQTNTIRTTETCSNTLLDTINHVLDFAKINNLTRGSRMNERAKKKGRRRSTPNALKERSAAQPSSLSADINLSAVVEEVLETSYAGYEYRQRAPAPLDIGDANVISAQNVRSSGRDVIDATPTEPGPSRLSVVVEIDKTTNRLFHTQPGAWRRVVMNLFGNALKYTEKGFIKVQLQAEPQPSNMSSPTSSQVILIVTDSGRGMSQEYIRDRLFHPFAQEDPLSPGTGLGLNIIQQIVTQQLGGHIDVRSEKGRGTEIRVTCTLKHSQSPLACNRSSDDQTFGDLLKRTQGRRIGLLGFDTQPVTGSDEAPAALFVGSFKRVCADWFDMDVVLGSEEDGESPDICLGTESYTRRTLAVPSATSEERPSPTAANGNRLAPPLITVCQASSSVQAALCAAATKPSGRIIECISQPCGPRKLAKVLVSCLDRCDARSAAAQDSAAPPLPILPTRTASDSFTIGRSTEHDRAVQEPIGNRCGSIKASGQDEGLEPTGSTISMSTAPQTLPTPSPSTQETRSSDHDSSSSEPPLHLLLVDDNPVNLNLLKTYATRNHHPFTTATNGLEAIEAYKTAHLDSHHHHHSTVILMDISMPVMDGMSATRGIRAFEREKGIKPATVVALTGLASAAAQQEARASGVDLFLTKPVRLKELGRVLGEVKGRKEAAGKI